MRINMTYLSLYKRAMQILLFLLALLYTSINGSAEVICKNDDAPEIHGKIEKGDFSKLLLCLKNFVAQGMPSTVQEGKYKLKRIGWVWFNSKGGDVNEAIKIGRFLRESLADIGVNEQCSSACFLAIVGSVKISAPFADIGIHRLFLDSATLKQTDVKDYESYYNELKKGARQYCYDMDVPTPVVEKMFSVSSREIYTLTPGEISQLGKHPAYDEWINSKCPDSLVGKEKKDYDLYVSSGFKNVGYSAGYIDHLKQKNAKYEQCEDAVRWEQFKKTVAKYLKK